MTDQKIRLTKPQMTALSCIDDEGLYGRSRDCAPWFSPNYYHERHQPGNVIIDVRTANVLVKHGFAEIRWGRIFRTEAGRDFWRANRA